MRMQDKVVVITGAGSGLGRESALLFAAEGARVVVTDLIADRAEKVTGEVSEAGGQAVWRQADVRVEADMQAAVALATDTWGRLDVMFANAGIAEIGFGSVAFEDLTLENWNAVQATNLTGVFLAAKAAAPVMKAQGSGNIVVTSSASSYAAYPHFISYTASKHGVNGLVKVLAFELGRFGIRVNALCPTHGMSANLAMAPDAPVLGKSYEELQPWDKANAAMPLRLDRPPVLRDNANVALFLASDESGYMSGVCLPATDGGTLSRVAIIFPEDLGGSGLGTGVTS
ncbi:SDR family oxidoreductase [Kineosporia rhizophila]|uniref:SDR family NAD(P)-dependent oxidoreductase n=1 Tax=Kineosporia rhizophila TaxID=84633 RepID=UPI001E2A073D|nr:SDR family NAD(P)-dependent oxidoreductase [Kineosporia rhizophila]MCE0535476.1 SDR family oxidoreductase [Kineosporia rhizophila]